MTSEGSGGGLTHGQPSDDVLVPFQLESSGIRGRFSRLGTVVDTIIGRHGYPEVISRLLGETMALATILAGALKYDGVFTLQAKGEGPVRTLMADVTSEGDIRAYAAFDADALPAEVSSDEVSQVTRLLGGGYLAFTVDQGVHTDRYQGIVPLEGATLAECTHAYFRQSEQIDSAIKLACARDDQGSWRASALMLQRMPFEPVARPGQTPMTIEDYDEDWRTALALMSSASDAETLDPDLTPDRLLYRLFNEPGVRAYDRKALGSTCRCSTERVESAIGSIPPASLEDMKIDGLVVVTCEFCKSEWRYDDAALDAMRERLTAAG